QPWETRRFARSRCSALRYCRACANSKPAIGHLTGKEKDRFKMTASIREGSVQADGVEIKYVEAGAGEPVVYLHGADGLRLTEAHRRLAEKNRFIAFQIPAFDALSEKSHSHKLTEIATVLSKAVAAVGLEEFSLMGHSVGADLALRMAIAGSKAVKAVILI